MKSSPNMHACSVRVAPLEGKKPRVATHSDTMMLHSLLLARRPIALATSGVAAGLLMPLDRLSAAHAAAQRE